MLTGRAFAINPDSDSKGSTRAKDLGRVLFLAVGAWVGFRAFSRLELSRFSNMDSRLLGAEAVDLGLSLLLYVLLGLLTCFLVWLFLVKRGAIVDPQARTVTEWWSLYGLRKETTHKLDDDSWLELRSITPSESSEDQECEAEHYELHLHCSPTRSLLVRDQVHSSYPSQERAQDFAEKLARELKLELIETDREGVGTEDHSGYESSADLSLFC